MPNLRTCLIMSLAALVLPGAAFAADDCIEVLAKDYEKIAASTSLTNDYLRVIDREAWEQLSIKHGAEASLFGVELGHDYESFSSRRQAHFETVSFHRSVQESTDILRIVTNERAYPAYEACLRSQAPKGLVAWISNEDMNTLEIRIRYNYTAGLAVVRLEGSVEGGLVSGAPEGRVWRGAKRWKPATERVFTVRRQPGTTETVITIEPTNGDRPVTLRSQRADGLMELRFVGTTEKFRRVVSASQPTPDNDGNKDGCPNEVGRAQGGFCKSRTWVHLEAAPGRVLKKATMACDGAGCPWATIGRTQVSEDSRAAKGYVDNWGLKVSARLSAEEWEIVGADQCVASGPLPVVLDSPRTISTTVECAEIAIVTLTHPGTNAQSLMKFGDAASSDGLLKRGSPVLERGTGRVTTYVAVAESDPQGAKLEAVTDLGSEKAD